jgi:hypothetical protein
MSFVYLGVAYTCNGFSDGKTKSKHFKKHVKGVPANAFGAGDMTHLNIPDANAYQSFAVSFMNMPYQYHAVSFPVVTLETSAGNLARWDQNQGFFGAMRKDGTLVTFHMRPGAHLFQQAVLEY